MPGTPFYNEMSRLIEAIGEDKLFLMIADGKPMQEVADVVGCSRSMIYLWIRRSPDRQEKFRMARELSSHVLAEDAGNVLDTATATSSAAVSLAVAKANYKKWLAGVRNHKEYGEQARTPPVQINIQSLHLDALREYGRVVTPALEGDEVTDADFLLGGNDGESDSNVTGASGAIATGAAGPSDDPTPADGAGSAEGDGNR
jgi:hypothetical protein